MRQLRYISQVIDSIMKCYYTLNLKFELLFKLKTWKNSFFCYFSSPSVTNTYTQNLEGSIYKTFSCWQQTERKWIYHPLLYTLACYFKQSVCQSNLFRFWRDKCLSHKASIIHSKPKMSVWLEFVHIDNGMSSDEKEKMTTFQDVSEVFSRTLTIEDNGESLNKWDLALANQIV